MSPIGPPPAPGEPGPSSSPPPRPPAPSPGASSLPERMKANKALAGKTCPACNGPISLGADVWNCRACGTPHHAPCREQAGSCMADGCTAAAETPSEGGGETKACPYCGEAVLKAAKKCKHCKEVLSPALRAARERQAKGTDSKVGRDALICGIVGLIICGPILGTMAIVKGIEARKRDVGAGMGTAGIVLGILDWVFMIIVLISKMSN